MLDWTHSQKQICRLRIKYKTLTWKLYSPHSFRRGGASFAFRCNVPAEIIQRQGDWQSDAYLIYLEMSSAQKRRAVNSMASHILQLSSPWCTIPFFFPIQLVAHNFTISLTIHALSLFRTTSVWAFFRFLAGVYWFSYDLFRYQCIVQLSNLTQ